MLRPDGFQCSNPAPVGAGVADGRDPSLSHCFAGGARQLPRGTGSQGARERKAAP